MKLNNKGVALIYVIVTLTVIMLLSSAALSTAYTNLKIKQMEINMQSTTRNVYSVIDTIVSEMTVLASDAYNMAYLDTLGEMTSTDNEIIINSKCKDKFIDELLNRLGDKDGIDDESRYSDETLRRAGYPDYPNWKDHYSVDMLNKLADSRYPSVEIGVGDDPFDRELPEVTEKKIQYIITADSGKNLIERTQDGIVLKNVHVLYRTDGILDELTTDIHINTAIVDNAVYPVITYSYVPD